MGGEGDRAPEGGRGLRVRVARSPSRVWKLCTREWFAILPGSVRFAGGPCVARAGRGASALATGEGRAAPPAAGRIGIVEQHRGRGTGACAIADNPKIRQLALKTGDRILLQLATKGERLKPVRGPRRALVLVAVRAAERQRSPARHVWVLPRGSPLHQAMDGW